MASRAEQTSDRCDRYRARVVAHLPTLADDAARRRFIRSEIAKWIERKQQFETEVMLGCYRGEATAFDFAITLADLDKIAAELKEPAHV